MKVRPCYLALALMLVSLYANSATWVTVEGHGRTLEEAKQNGFRNAVREVVGQLIISDTEVSGDIVTKDFIGDYSAGYVSDYEIQQTHYDDPEVIVNMNVSVSSSKIADRMRTNSNHKTTLSGEKLQEKIDSILEQRTKGDRILSNVVGSYPHNAYILNSGETQAVIGSRRQVYFDIPYEIHWSRYWIDSLLETLDNVAIDSKSCRSMSLKKIEQLGLTVSIIKFIQEKSCGQEADMTVSYKNANEWMTKKSNFYFPDLTTLDVINHELRTPLGQQHVGLVIELKDAGGDIISTHCARVATEPLLEYRVPQNEVINWSHHQKQLRPVVNGQASIAGTVRIQANNSNLSNVTRLDMHLEKTCN
jgi:hypothetical protein